jgi:dehydrogenase/reductase SDR family protein 7
LIDKKLHKKMWKLFLIITAVVLAIFFKSDVDLPVAFLPYEEKGAFAEKVVWIVGASSGIGAALAVDMTKAGAKVIISARRNDKLIEVSDLCAEHGERPYVMVFDVTQLAVHQSAVDSVIQKYGHIDHIVLNAGMSQRNTAVDTPLSVTQDLMHLNFMSVVSLAKEVLPGMIARKTGQIVVTSSLSGIIGTPLGSSYSATKFALHGYFNALRSEVAQHGLSVLLVCPGPVESEISSKAHRNPNLPVSSDEKKMPTARCTHLMAKAMYHRLMEVWISDQPLLAMTYITQYFPTLSQLLFSRVLGPARVRALQNGGDVYDIKAMFTK